MNVAPQTVSQLHFTSWRSVRIGGFNLREMSSAGSGVSWRCATGLAYDDRGTATATERIVQEGGLPVEDLEEHIRHVSFAPHGIRLAAQPPTRIKFTDRLGMPTEGWPGPLTILFDEGRYKCWHTFLPDIPSDQRPVEYPWHGFNHYLCYAESTDGFNWTKPKLGLVKHNGRRDNNILMTPYVLEGRPRGMFGPNVFVDPHGDAAERYKMVYFARFTEAEVVAFVKKHPGHHDVMAYSAGYWGCPEGPAFGIAGAVSPDGTHWQPLDEPLLIHHSDTVPNATFDPQLGRYVCYMRMWPRPTQSPESPGIIGRRSVGRSTSADFRQWSQPELLLNAGADVAPSMLYYGPGHTWLPGSDTEQVLFVNRWKQDDDTMDLSLFATPDGWTWSPVPGGESFIAPGAIGTWEGSCIFGGAQLIELPGARWALPYMGMPIPHKYPRINSTKRRLHPGVEAHRGYAVWPKGRLVALECPDEGAFATVAVKPAGARLFLNAAVEPAGFIKVGLRQLAGGTNRLPESAPIPGRAAADCDVIWGRDDLEIPVTWKGEDQLRADGQPVVVSFQLRRAKLFGLSYR